MQRLSNAGVPFSSAALSLQQSQLLQLLQPHVADVREGAGADQVSAVVEHVCREQGVARGSMDAALTTLGADAKRGVFVYACVCVCVWTRAYVYVVCVCVCTVLCMHPRV